MVFYGRANPDFVSDFDQVWAATHALWVHQNPYTVVGLHGSFLWKWPLYYPLPALLVVAPLGLLPVLAARAIFVAVSVLLLAWGSTREGWQRWPMFISVSFLVTIELSQWSALLAAAYFLPWLAMAGVAKPNIGVAIGAASRGDRTLAWLAGGALVLVAASEIIQPGWHRFWLENLRSAPHFRAAVVRPFGFLLLFSALKWRRPEGRWLLALSVVPLPPSFYDQLLLAIVCLTTRETLIFAVSTVVLFFYVGFNTPQPDYASWGKLVGDATVWFCYFPVLVMLLRRPNEGILPPVPAVLTRFLARRRRAA